MHTLHGFRQKYLLMAGYPMKNILLFTKLKDNLISKGDEICKCFLIFTFRVGYGSSDADFFKLSDALKNMVLFWDTVFYLRAVYRVAKKSDNKVFSLKQMNL